LAVTVHCPVCACVGCLVLRLYARALVATAAHAVFQLELFHYHGMPPASAPLRFGFGLVGGRAAGAATIALATTLPTCRAYATLLRRSLPAAAAHLRYRLAAALPRCRYIADCHSANQAAGARGRGTGLFPFVRACLRGALRVAVAFALCTCCGAAAAVLVVTVDRVMPADNVKGVNGDGGGAGSFSGTGSVIHRARRGCRSRRISPAWVLFWFCCQHVASGWRVPPSRAVVCDARRTRLHHRATVLYSYCRLCGRWFFYFFCCSIHRRLPFCALARIFAVGQRLPLRHAALVHSVLAVSETCTCAAFYAPRGTPAEPSATRFGLGVGMALWMDSRRALSYYTRCAARGICRGMCGNGSKFTATVRLRLWEMSNFCLCAWKGWLRQRRATTIPATYHALLCAAPVACCLRYQVNGLA